MSATQTATQKFDQLVRQSMARGTPRQRAVIAVARRNPNLHRAAICEANQGKDPKILAAVRSGARTLYPAVGKRPATAAAKPAVPTPAATKPTAPVRPSVPSATIGVQRTTISEAERDALLRQALAERRARGLDGSRALDDLLKSEDAWLWNDGITEARQRRERRLAEKRSALA